MNSEFLMHSKFWAPLLFCIYLSLIIFTVDSHSIFGRVSGGIDTVRRIGLVSTTEDEK